MQKTVSTVWISSIEHMNKFSEISRSNPIWKVFLSINKVPADFPQMKSNGRILPIVYFSKGVLQIFERQIDFKSHLSNNDNIYKNIDSYFNFEIQYKDFKVDRFIHPSPFMKSFNIPWIKLSILNKNPDDHLLISYGAPGVQMTELKYKNDELFEILKEKVNE